MGYKDSCLSSPAPSLGFPFNIARPLLLAGSEDMAGSTHGTRAVVLALALRVGINRLNTMLNLISMLSKLSKADFPH